MAIPIPIAQDDKAYTFSDGTVVPRAKVSENTQGIWNAVIAKSASKEGNAAANLGGDPGNLFSAPPVVTPTGPWKSPTANIPAAPGETIDLNGPPPVIAQKPGTMAAPGATTTPDTTKPTDTTLPPMLMGSEVTKSFTSGVKADEKSLGLQTKANVDRKEALRMGHEAQQDLAAAQTPVQQRMNSALDDIDARADIQRQAVARDTAQAQRNYATAVDTFGKMKVDHNRWWNNKSTGEKFGLTLAAALSTFGSSLAHSENTGMAVINREIDKDVADQRDAIMNAKEGIDLKNNLVAQLRTKGLDLEQSTLAAKQIKLEQAKRQLAEIAANHGAQIDQAAFAAANAELDKSIADTKVAASVAAQGRSTVNRTESMKSPTPGAGKVDESTAMKLGEASAASQNAGKLLEMWQKKAGSVGSWLLSKLPLTDASRYGDNAKAAAQVIGTYLEGGKLTDADYPRYLSMLPQPGDSDATAKNKTAAIQDLIGARQAAQKQALNATGHDTSAIKDAKPRIDFKVKAAQ